VLARELSIAETDALTGVRTRAAGLRELTHELDRSHETNAALVVAYVDVVGLKQLNDTLGHGAGDELLRHVAQLFTSHLRSYDLVVRLGGDEFLCAISGLPEAFAQDRFRAIAAELAAPPDARRIRTGFATLRAGESAPDLIARADADMVRRRNWSGREDAVDPSPAPEI
jgi:diguanylate cyclase (GGDEF)-like protein